MTAQKFLLFATVAVLSAVLARSHPTHVRVVDLSEVLNKTVCPIVVDVDVNMDRVPQRIKVMRCAREPNHWCEAQHIPRHECCQHSHANHQMECVEMRDTVLVYYKSTKKIKTHEVSVGCSCMIEQSTRVPRIPESPT